MRDSTAGRTLAQHWPRLLVALASLGLCLLCLGRPAALAGGPTAAADPDYATVIDVGALQLFPLVRLGERCVQDLEASDFVVLDEGEPVAIEYFSREVTTLSVALVIDVSASMRANLESVQEAACRLTDRLGPEDRILVFGFNHELVVAARSSTDHAVLKTAIRGLEPGGETAMFDALTGVIAQLADEPGRGVIVVFTDGEDRSSNSPRSVADAARDRGITIYAVGVPEMRTDLEARHALHVLADRTGGRAYTPGGLAKLGSVYDRIIADMRFQYRLAYTPPPGPPGLRHIEVKTRSGEHRVLSRRSYVR